MWWRSDQTDEMESASSELAKISPSSALRSQKWIGLGSSPLQVFMPLQSDSKSVCIALSNTIQGNYTLFENEDLSAKAEIIGQMLKNLVFRWDLFSLNQAWIIHYQKISDINLFFYKVIIHKIGILFSKQEFMNFISYLVRPSGADGSRWR